MSHRVCRCGLPLWNQDTFCLACLRATRHHLANQASHLDDLVTEQTRMAKKQVQQKVRRTPDPTSWPRAGDMFLDQVTKANLRDWDRRSRKAGDLIADQRNTLVKWCRTLAEEGASWPADTIPAMAMHIDANLKHLRNKDDGPELVLEIRNLSQAILTVIDVPEKRTVVIGACPNRWPLPEGGDDWCPGEVRVILWADENRPVEATCSACKQEWPSQAFTGLEKGIAVRAEREAEVKTLAARMAKGKASA